MGIYGHKLDHVLTTLSELGKKNGIMKSNVPICLKQKAHNQYLITACIEGSETWIKNTKIKQKPTTQKWKGSCRVSGGIYKGTERQSF